LPRQEQIPLPRPLKKIVILSSGLGPNTRGIGQYERYLLPPLLRKLNVPGCRIFVVLSKEGRVSTENERVRFIRLPIHRGRTFQRIFLEQFYLPYLSGGADVFLSLESVFPLTPLLAKTKIVVVHDIHVIRHTLQPEKYPEDYSTQYKIWANRATRKALRKASAVVTDAEFTKREICDVLRIPQDKVSVIPCGLDRERFYPLPDSCLLAEIRRRYQLPESFYLFIGPYSRKKNLRLIIEAYASLSRDLEYVRPVAVVGDTRKSELYQDTLELIRRTGREDLFLFLGLVPDDDIPALYRAARAFLYPSLYEGFGLPVLEAMACGTPVIASNQSSIPEVAGEAALLIDPYDPETLKKALEKINVREVRESLIEKGYRQTKSFSWEKTAGAMADLILGSK